MEFLLNSQAQGVSSKNE